ncbi:MAG: putative endoribonuclease [Sphingomonas bacterium]|uniref:RidA family protein n=1 Tax=Sphingomonas bacterium TaxID=1895847 RepID=UPI00260F5D32|nr:RidA family protein [Sphingomonas bacterium]MDB5694974.1 putative endoribonuclease [Sphingomonas bacterium]
MTKNQAPPLSKSRRAGNLLFLSGQLARGADGAIVDGDIRIQTRQVLANIEAVLAGEGATLADVVKVTAWITDLSDMEGFNEVYRAVMPEPFPARSTVFCELAAGKVEIEVLAVLE